MRHALTYVDMPTYAQMKERLQTLPLPPTDLTIFLDILNNALFGHRVRVSGMISGPEYIAILTIALDSYAGYSRSVALYVPAMHLLELLVSDQSVIREASRPLVTAQRLHAVRCGAEN